MADKTGKRRSVRPEKLLFYDELAQGGPPTRPPRTAQARRPEFAHGGPLGLQLVGRDAGLFHALHLVLHRRSVR